MFEVFSYVDKFFQSLANYLTYNHIFLIFMGLFLISMIGVIISTAHSYEAKLLKSIDKFNYYFIDTPYLNEDNLVAFNQRMKSKKVPKQLRKYWQQFVLYREDKASSYMSFDNCVANPIKNSTYTRDTKLLNRLTWIFSLCALVLNCYYCFETVDTAAVLRGVLLTPILIILLNYIIQIFLSLRHNAIVSDLFQNYQYFQVNIDKATETLPEYVDYEVLFDKNEIKKGIPILYTYLQKRAEEEKRELERARLRNVEHEKFNFDDQGVAGSLVLERAMQEAENYIAERKKYTQDIGQINADITSEDMNYREITKEYNRQMQVSKETFANFKAQLEEASSTIEANYLKKQQQQELDRQRNLERDFDAATEKHKKIIDSFQYELDTIDKFIAQSRQNLENAMKSEFQTYSAKVYDEVKKAVDKREQDKDSELLANIQQLEESLHAKKQEAEELYKQNQAMSEQLSEIELKAKKKSNKDSIYVSSNQNLDYNDSVQLEKNNSDEQQTTDLGQSTITNNEEQPESVNESDSFIAHDNIPNEVQPVQEVPTMSYEEYLKTLNTDTKIPMYENAMGNNTYSNSLDEVKNNSTEQTDDSINSAPLVKRGRPRKVAEDQEEIKEKRKAGRPRKVQAVETSQPKKKVGRPRKNPENTEISAVKKVGRPGRPRKVQTVEANQPKKKVGRPRKNLEVDIPKKVGKPGRPKKVKSEEELNRPKRGRGRPRKELIATKEESSQTQNKENIYDEIVVPVVKKGRGRPKKQSEAINLDNIQEIDDYLKEIDKAIAMENLKMEKSQKELAKKSSLKRKKK